MKNKEFILVMLLYFCIGCATVNNHTKIKIDHNNPEKTMSEVYLKVNLEDGIDRNEAKNLASTYFLLYISGCGVVSEILDKIEKWEAKTLFGYGAMPYESIMIDKKSGKITCKVGPSIDPKTISINKSL